MKRHSLMKQLCAITSFLITVVFSYQNVRAYGPGLLYSDGIEQGDASVCEAPSGKKCWYVDADAMDGGDGSFVKPFNSFESAVGYMDSSSNYHTGKIAGGDILYVKGTFRGSTYNASSHNTSIEIRRSSQLGTIDMPTIIKSWRGSPRAVFDGEYMQKNLIYISSISPSSTASIKIYNVEIVHAQTRGIYIAENMNSAEVINVIIHDGSGDGIDGTGGGITFRLTSGSPQYILRNSVIYGNYRNRVGGDNNIGGVSILSEGTAQNGSRISIFDNIIYDEVIAIRHKHSGNCTMEAYNNIIHDSLSAFYLRSYFNKIHGNILYNVTKAFDSVAENQQGDTDTDIYNNTIYNASICVDTGYDTTTYKRTIKFNNNIYYNMSAIDGIFRLGRWSTNVFDINGWVSANNIIYYNNGPGVVFLYHQGLAHSYSNGLITMKDTTSTLANPQFQNSLSFDFSLKQTSPAWCKGSDGSTIGAITRDSGNPLGTKCLRILQ